MAEVFGEFSDGLLRGLHHFLYAGVGFTAGIAFFYGRYTVFKRINQGLAALGVFQQIVLQIWVARHHPQIAQDLKQHARTASGFALTAQVV